MPVIRPKQRGVALLFMVMVLSTVGMVMVSSSLMASRYLSGTSRIALDSLKQAREALIYRALTDANHPGSLPCPDVDGDGYADSMSGNQCRNGYSGFFPYRTLGIAVPESPADRITYMFDARFRDATAAEPINSEIVTAGSPAFMLGMTDSISGSRMSETMLQSDLMRLTERLVMTKVLRCLQDYASRNGNTYPLTLSLTGVTNLLGSDLGRVAVSVSVGWSATKCAFLRSNSDWFIKNQWQNLIFYRTGSLQIAHLAHGTTVPVVVIGAGARLGTQARPGLLLADYLEGFNLLSTESIFEKRDASAVFNDQIAY